MATPAIHEGHPRIDIIAELPPGVEAVNGEARRRIEELETELRKAEEEKRRIEEAVMRLEEKLTAFEQKVDELERIVPRLLEKLGRRSRAL